MWDLLDMSIRLIMFVPKSNFHYLSYLKAQAAGYGEGYRKYLALNNYFKDKTSIHI